MSIQAMWSRYLCLLAQNEVPDPVQPGPAKGVQFSLNQEVLLVAGIALAVGALIALWAVFFRKRRSSDPHQRAIQSSPFVSEASPAPREHRHGRRRHRRRRSRGAHGHRNPTLQETGGLPAPRGENELPGA